MALTPAKDTATSIKTAIGVDFTIPVVDLNDAEFQLPTEVGNPLYDAVTKPTFDELTTGAVDGAGAFDKMMASHKAHLKEQFDLGLITGDQYTKAYIQLTTAALSAATQFVLTGEQQHWQAILVQLQARKAEIEAVTAKVGLETAKAQLAAATSQAQILEAQYVQTMLQIAVEDAKYQLTHKQIELVSEQVESQRGQTMSTRTDGTTAIAGMLGKQQDLYTQQIDSYQKDAAYKAGKMYLDAWITQKTLDEGLLAPDELTNATVDVVLEKIRTDLGLVATP